MKNVHDNFFSFSIEALTKGGLGQRLLRYWTGANFDLSFRNRIRHFNTIALSFSESISIYLIFIISISTNSIKSFSISSNFRSNDVIGSAPDVTWNSNWPTWKSLYSFPGRLPENPAALVEEEKEPQEEEADVGVRH